MNLLQTSFLALTLGIAGAAFAQVPDQTATPSPRAVVTPQRQPNPAREAKRLSRELGLTGDQTAQLTPILADREQRIQALDSNTSLDVKSMHKQRRAIMLDTEQKLNSILTPAQQQQFAAIRAQRKQHEAPPTAAPSL